MIFQKAILNLLEKPKRLFLIDGLGAMVSAFMLGVVLIRFQTAFGIPKATLYLLALFPFLFAIYDFYCYNSKTRNTAIHLKTVAIANFAYCILSIGLTIYHYQEVQALGFGYIIIEVLVIAILVALELQVAKQLN